MPVVRGDGQQRYESEPRVSRLEKNGLSRRFVALEGILVVRLAHNGAAIVFSWCAKRARRLSPARSQGTRQIPSWTAAQTMMSVRVNGTYLPFKSAPDLMQRFVRPALFSTGDAVFELQVFGTALMATYRGWDFALATAHQVDTGRGAPSAKSFVVVVERDGKRLTVPPSSVHLPHVDEEEFRSLGDLIFFDYAKVTDGHRSSHLDITNVYWSDASEVVPDYSFVIGYPTGSTMIEVDLQDESQLSQFTLRWIRQDLQRSDGAPMDPENRLMFVKHERSTRLSIDPDGLSGSPVFSIVHDRQKERHLRFEGIVTNARDDRFAVLPSAQIRPVLDVIVDADR